MPRRIPRRSALGLHFLLCTAVNLSLAAPCPGANPNDAIPDDAALQACLTANLQLDLSPGVPGYIIAEGLLIVQNGTRITSIATPELATLIADAALSWPMIMTNGTISGLTLDYLIIDGNRDARAVVSANLCSTASGATNDNYRTSNVMLPGFRYPDGSWNCWDPNTYFVDGVAIEHCVITRSPCGAGIGISGRDYVIRDNEVTSNGWDTNVNPQALGFPYADGINAAVCFNGSILNNTLTDNTNMIIANGPGPHCTVAFNTLLQVASASQNGINLWPTNSWGPPVWWHPNAWDFRHSVVFNNTLKVNVSDKNAAMYSGVAVGGLPWADVWVDNAGEVLNNAVEVGVPLAKYGGWGDNDHRRLTACPFILQGTNVGLLVDGVMGGTVWGNAVTALSGNGHPSNCRSTVAYSAANANGTLLYPGWENITFNPTCNPAPPVSSTSDASEFAVLLINGVVPSGATVNVTAGNAFTISLAFRNSGTSSWQGSMWGQLGYKAGDTSAPLPPSPPPWGQARVLLGRDEFVQPNSVAWLNGTLSAPTEPGRYILGPWRMVHELVDWFGQASATVDVFVEAA